MSCRHEWAGAVIKGPVNHIVVDQCEKCGKLKVQTEPGADVADSAPLTDRIVTYMRDEAKGGYVFARTVAKALGVSSGSAAQGLGVLVARGVVLRKSVRSAPNVYWLNETSDEVKS